ncbi:MAG: CoA transferase, partial [Alphaproteobacteria bacterium]
RRPDVTWLSSQGFGRGGPLDRAPSFGPLVSAFAGVTWLQNHADAPWPAGSSLNHPDHLASKLGLAAVLAALLRRARTGAGTTFEMAQSEVAAWLQGEVYLEGPLTGRAPRPSGNAVAFACPHDVYPCAGRDRWCAIAAVGDGAWGALRRLLAWPLDPGLETLAGRLERRAEVDERVSAWTRTREPWEVARLLQAAGVSAMPVLSTLELRTDAHLAARGAFVRVDDPEVGSVLHCANPIRSGSGGRPAGPAPRLGADTDTVLRGVLGRSRDEVAELRRDGVCP